MKGSSRSQKRSGGIAREAFCFVAFACFLLAGQAFAQVSLESELERSEPVQPLENLSLLGQNTIDGRTGNIVTQNRIKSPVYLVTRGFTRYEGAFSLYVGAHIEEDTMSRKGAVFNDNFIAPLVGASLAVPQLGLGAFSEIQYQMRKREDLHPDDLRTVQGRFAVYHSFGRHSRQGRNLKGFVETYTEVVHRTELGQNVFASHASRLGPRFHFGGRWSFDAFPELVVKKDRAGLPWENQLDLRLGARVNFTAAKWTTSLQATGASGVFIGDRRYLSPIKGLVIVGIEI